MLARLSSAIRCNTVRAVSAHTRNASNAPCLYVFAVFASSLRYEPFRIFCLLRVWTCLRMFIATQIALAKRLSPHNADARLQLSGLRYTDRSGAAQVQDVPSAIAPLAHDRRVASGPPRVPVACVGVPRLVLLVPPRPIRTASAARAATARAAGHAHSYQPGHALSRKRRKLTSAASEQQRGK